MVKDGAEKVTGGLPRSSILSEYAVTEKWTEILLAGS